MYVVELDHRKRPVTQRGKRTLNSGVRFWIRLAFSDSSNLIIDCDLLSHPPASEFTVQDVWKSVLLTVLLVVCGVLGLLLHDSEAQAATEIFDGLSLLQHRGQDACGIVTCGHKGRLYQCKANGMVRDVFDHKSLSTLVGSMGIGHGKSSSFPPVAQG